MSLVKSFPASLPCALRNSTLKPVATFTRSEMENGIARQRRRYKRTPTLITVEWRFTQDQYEQFVSFFDHELEGGVYWFNILLRAQNGLKERQCRVTTDPPYEASFSGSRWRITTTLETMDRM